MKFKAGDKVKSTKPITVNANIKVLVGANGVIDDCIDLSKFYGEYGKTYWVIFEEILQVMVFEYNLEATE